MDVTDFIDIEVLGLIDGGCFDPFPNTPCTSQFYNVGHAELDGFELEARYDIGRLYGIVTYATIDGKDLDEGDHLGVLQPNKFYLDLGVRYPEYWTRVGTRLTWAGELTKVDDEDERRAAYNTVGVYASIAPTEGSLKGFRLVSASTISSTKSMRWSLPGPLSLGSTTRRRSAGRKSGKGLDRR